VKWTDKKGQTIKTDYRTSNPTGAAVTDFSIQKPGGWPAGDYSVEVLVRGTTAAVSKAFKVIRRRGLRLRTALLVRGQHPIPAVSKVPVEREESVQREAIDDFEADAVGERQPLVGEALHLLEGATQQAGVDEDEAVAAALESVIGEPDGPGGVGPDPKPRHRLGQDQIREDEPRVLRDRRL
jgi:hypothetical protein